LLSTHSDALINFSLTKTQRKDNPDNLGHPFQYHLIWSKESVCQFSCFCQSCHDQIAKPPDYTASYGNSNPEKVVESLKANKMSFPVKPNVLKDLTPLEERLISPRIPFMQVR
jgi:hypothetical protein